MTIEFDPVETAVSALRAAAEDHPERVFIGVDGREFSYGDVWSGVVAVARGLSASGISPGDRIAIIAPNSLQSMLAWFGAHLAGAVDAPISVDASGAYLAHVIDDLKPAAVIGTTATLSAAASATDVGSCLRVVIGAPGRSMPDDALSFDDLVEQGRASREAMVPPDAWQLGTIMYSSGTTGPSKGVMLSHGYYATLARVHAEFAQLPQRAKIYCVQPLCHIDARSAVVDAIHLGGSIVVGERFSASRFWDEVEFHDADVIFYVGTMIHLLAKQPGGERARRSPRRIGIGSATPVALHQDFERRFDVHLIEGYGLTEFGLITGQTASRPELGTVGEVLPWVEARLVDDRDREVDDGAVGELIVRPREQHLHMLGYWNNPEATLEAWRGLWFHTGDLLRRTPRGSLEYIGRTKDSIRRRGENVSAWEVEEAAARHPEVLEAAAIGVPSELGDEDVALLVVPVRGADLDPSDLRCAMRSDVPKYALPRYIEVLQSLPKTPSERIAKALVRERGITAAAHDFDDRRG